MSNNDTKPKGLCEQKCSKREQDFRIKNHLLHPLECQNPFDKIAPRNRKPIRERMCKAYSRPAANQTIKIGDLRTSAALKESLDYLLEVEEEFKLDSQWTLTYEFMADRFRAIRQDIIVQQLNDASTSYLLEQMICFYVRARDRSERLKTPTYNATLHSRELDECLEREKQKGYEFSIYFIPIHNPDIFAQLRSQRDFIAKQTYRLLWDLFSAFVIQNYVRFFCLISKLDDPLQIQILMPAIKWIRLHAFEALSASTKSPACSVPLNDLNKWLKFLNDEMLKKCADECFDKSPLHDEKTVKFHGCKMKAFENSALLSYEWSLVNMN
ncbi:WD-REPEATS-REGION domain-containing protein [Aphelenchoides bicaudatus]|nr:WD-REPEATS-REGION domain-containing protein [Aphelenchoides bicaudatus]